MIASKTVWRQLLAEHKSRVTLTRRAATLLYPRLAASTPHMQDKFQRLVAGIYDFEEAFQFIVDRAQDLVLDDEKDTRALFADPEFADKARQFSQARGVIHTELDLWEPAADQRRDALTDELIAFFRQCEALEENYNGMLELCQVQFWVWDDGILHYTGEEESPEKQGE